MTDRSTACCRACEKEFTFAPSQRTFPTPTGTTIVPPRLCPECEAARHEEDERLLAAARTDRSLAHAYRCRGCRRIFLLLRPWTRAGGLLFCPECRPGYFRQNPADAEINRAHGYPRF